MAGGAAGTGLADDGGGVAGTVAVAVAVAGTLVTGALVTGDEAGRVGDCEAVARLDAPDVLDAEVAGWLTPGAGTLAVPENAPLGPVVGTGTLVPADGVYIAGWLDDGDPLHAATEAEIRAVMAAHPAAVRTVLRTFT